MSIYIAHWSGRAQAEERPWTVGPLTDSKKKKKKKKKKRNKIFFNLIITFTTLSKLLMNDTLSKKNHDYNIAYRS